MHLKYDLHNFLRRINNLFLSLNILVVSGFQPKIILKLFLHLKGATTSENERNVFKYL